jgi:hypothetical protein
MTMRYRGVVGLRVWGLAIAGSALFACGGDGSSDAAGAPIDVNVSSRAL